MESFIELPAARRKGKVVAAVSKLRRVRMADISNSLTIRHYIAGSLRWAVASRGISYLKEESTYDPTCNGCRELPSSRRATGRPAGFRQNHRHGHRCLGR